MEQFVGDQEQDRVVSSAPAHGGGGRDSERRREGDRLPDERSGGEQDQIPFREGMNNGAWCEVQDDAFKDSRRMMPVMVMQE